MIFIRFTHSLGPYYADSDHNDEMLWNYIVENNEGELSNTFNIRKHEFIADRGFLRCKEDGYVLHAPRPLAQGTHQYTCEDANYSRRVTRIRYVKNEEE